MSLLKLFFFSLPFHSFLQEERREEKNEFISTEKWNFININFLSFLFFPLAFIAHFNGNHISLLSGRLPSARLSLFSKQKMEQSEKRESVFFYKTVSHSIP